MLLVLVVGGHHVGLSLTLGLTGGHETVEVEFISVSFAVDFGHYVLVVVVPETNINEI